MIANISHIITNLTVAVGAIEDILNISWPNPFKKAQEDAPEKVTTSNPPRTIQITIASLVAFATGIIGFIGCVLTLVLFFNNKMGTIPYLELLINSLGNISGDNTKYVGISVMVVSFFHIIAGYMLWNSLKKGGIFGMVISAIDLSSFIFAFIFPPLAFVLNCAFLMGAVLVSMITLSWDSLC